MSVVTEGTPEDEASSRNGTSCLKSGRDSPIFHAVNASLDIRSGSNGKSHDAKSAEPPDV